MATESARYGEEWHIKAHIVGEANPCVHINGVEIEHDIDHHLGICTREGCGQQFETHYEVLDHNLVVNSGRVHALARIVGMTAGLSFPYLGVGSDNGTILALANTNLTLGNELIANASRITCTDTVGNPLSSDPLSTIVADSSVSPYQEKIVIQGVYGTSDANNGSTFAEYGLFSTATLPSTGSGTSGTMYNRFLPASSFVKSSSLAVTIQLTLRS